MKDRIPWREGKKPIGCKTDFPTEIETGRLILGSVTGPLPAQGTAETQAGMKYECITVNSDSFLATLQCFCVFVQALSLSSIYAHSYTTQLWTLLIETCLCLRSLKR